MRDSTVKSLHIELEEKNEQNEEISYRSSSPYSISLNDVSHKESIDEVTIDASLLI